ncbi:MAG: peroxiredoxin-like family protein [Pseudomonadota bacterium]
MTKLVPGQPVPTLKLDLAGGGHYSLADAKPQNFTMVVAYRGHHCPLCKGYLGKLNELVEAFADKGVEPVAISMNDENLASKAKEEWGLDKVPVAYGMSEDTARDWGLYISNAIRETEPTRFSEPGLYLVRPNGELYFVSVQNTPFTRPALDELLQRLDFIIDKGYPARGDAG